MTATGQIFDLGYQPYTGARQGRGRARWALYTQTLRQAFGLGRGARSKIIPFTLLGLALIPAAIQLGIVSLLGGDFQPIRYDNYLDLTSILNILFCATVAPELLCPDRRNRTLSLYFAHAISRLDYAAMKAAALLTALLAIALGPQVFLFVGWTLTVKDSWGYVTDNVDVIPRIVAAGLTVSLYLAMLALAVASLTTRRIFAAGGFIALFLISSATAGALWETFETSAARATMLFSLGELPFDASSWIFGVAVGPGSLAERTDLPGPLLFLTAVMWAAAGMLVVVRRYVTWEP